MVVYDKIVEIRNSYFLFSFYVLGCQECDDERERLSERNSIPIQLAIDWFVVVVSTIDRA